MRSDNVTKGSERDPNRSLFYALGYTDEELERAKKAIRLLGGEIEKIIDYTIPHTEITHRLVVIRKKNHTPKQYPRPFRKISASPL